MKENKQRRLWLKALPKKGATLLLPYFVILVLLIFLPVVFVGILSFSVQGGSNAVARSALTGLIFTFDNFINFFTTAGFGRTLALSLILGFIAGVISVIVAYPISYILHKTKGFKKINFLILITMPLWLNLLVQTFAVRSLISIVDDQILGTNLALLIGMVYLYLPLMILPIYNQLQGMDKKLTEASQDLGAGSFTTFFRIVFPLSLPGVLSGFILVFLTSATSLSFSLILGNGNIFLISALIQNEFINTGNYGLGSAIAVIIAIIVTLVTLGVGLLGRRILKTKHKKNQIKDSNHEIKEFITHAG